MRKFVFVGAIILAIAVMAFVMTPTTKLSLQGGSVLYQQGLGTYAPIPQTAGAVPASVASSLGFLATRSSVSFSVTFRNRLIALETASLTAGKPKLDAVAAMISSQALETIGTLTDSQIDAMGPVWRSIPDNNSADRAPLVHLVQEFTVPLDSWSVNAKEFRDGQTPQSQIWRQMFVDRVPIEVEKRTGFYAAVLPAQWGSDRFSPLQVILVAYALISGDYLEGSPSNLTAQMQGLSNYLQSHFGISAPITGREGYGVNGYIHSSPTDYLFTEQVANRILDRYEEAL